MQVFENSEEVDALRDEETDKGQNDSGNPEATGDPGQSDDPRDDPSSP